MEKIVETFLYQATLGVNVGTNSENKLNFSDLLEKCVSKAYDDMMTAGRFILKAGNLESQTSKTDNGNIKSTDKSVKVGKIKEYFLNNFENGVLSFRREYIDKVGAIIVENLKDDDVHKTTNLEESAFSFGLGQKTVNMTFKYLYCVKQYLTEKIDFSQCDCPIDSIILGTLKDDNRCKGFCWSKITREQYENVQSQIKRQINLEYPGYTYYVGNLYYDFSHWSN